MNDTQFDDFLRTGLRGSTAYLDDGDFSARVMARLPAPKRLNPWVEKLIVLVPVTVIALLVLSQFSLRELIQPAYAWVLTMDVSHLVSLAAIMMAVTVIASLTFVFRSKSPF